MDSNSCRKSLEPRPCFAHTLEGDSIVSNLVPDATALKNVSVSLLLGSCLSGGRIGTEALVLALRARVDGWKRGQLDSGA